MTFKHFIATVALLVTAMLPPYQRLGRVVRLPWATKLSYSTANRLW